jgi:hypothetical protein
MKSDMMRCQIGYLRFIAAVLVVKGVLKRGIRC